MKRLLAAAFAILILGAFTAHSVFAEGANTKSDQVMGEAILTFLSDDIFEAVSAHYGEPMQYMNVNLLSLRKVSEYPNLFEIILQVETFYNAHRPPYGIDTITFHVQYDGVKLTQFNHQDKPWSNKLWS